MDSNEFVKQKIVNSLIHYNLDVDNAKISRNLDKITLIDNSKNKAIFNMGIVTYKIDEEYIFLSQFGLAFSNG